MNQQQNSPEQPKKNWFLRHEFLYIVIGVLLIVVIAGSMVWWKTQKQIAENLAQQALTLRSGQSAGTADWKTYTSEQYGFEFKYPKEWIDQGQDIKLQNYLLKGRIDVLNFELIPDNGKTVVQSAQEELNENACPGNEDYIGDHLIKTDDKGTLYVLYCSASSEGYVYLTQLVGGGKLKIWYHDNFESNVPESEKLKVFNQILSTFKFIEPKITECTLKDKNNVYKQKDKNNFELIQNLPNYKILKDKGVRVKEICSSEQKIISISDYSGMFETPKSWNTNFENELVLGVLDLDFGNGQFYSTTEEGYRLDGPGSDACHVEKFLDNKIYFTCELAGDSGSNTISNTYDINIKKNKVLDSKFVPWGY